MGNWQQSESYVLSPVLTKLGSQISIWLDGHTAWSLQETKQTVNWVK